MSLLDSGVSWNLVFSRDGCQKVGERCCIFVNIGGYPEGRGMKKDTPFHTMVGGGRGLGATSQKCAHSLHLVKNFLSNMKYQQVGRLLSPVLPNTKFLFPRQVIQSLWTSTGILKNNTGTKLSSRGLGQILQIVWKRLLGALPTPGPTFTGSFELSWWLCLMKWYV